MTESRDEGTRLGSHACTVGACARRNDWPEVAPRRRRLLVVGDSMKQRRDIDNQRDDQRHYFGILSMAVSRLTIS